jgi:hypothetical protein
LQARPMNEDLLMFIGLAFWGLIAAYIVWRLWRMGWKEVKDSIADAIAVTLYYAVFIAPWVVIGWGIYYFREPISYWWKHIITCGGACP